MSAGNTHQTTPSDFSQAEDPVDPKPKIEAACHSACSLPATNYEKCVERITAKGSGNCEAWQFDYWKCIDKCVSRSVERLGLRTWPHMRLMRVIAQRINNVPSSPISCNAGCRQDLCATKVTELASYLCTPGSGSVLISLDGMNSLWRCSAR